MSREHGPTGLAIEWSPRGVVAYDAQTRQTRTAEDLASLGLKNRDAIVALSRRGVFVRTARVPNASPEEIRTILTMQVGELFPLPIIDLAWDFALTDDVNDEGRLAVLAAVPSADLRRTLEAASAAGLRIKATVPLAIGATILAHELGLAEAAVVERADDGPAVDVISGGALRTSRAAPASISLDTEVARALSLAGMELAPIVAAGGAEVSGAVKSTDRTALMAIAETSVDRLKLRLELPETVAARAAAAARATMRKSLAFLAVAVVAAAFVGYSRYKTSQDYHKAEVRANGLLQKINADKKKADAERDAAFAKRDLLNRAFVPAQRISDIVAVTTIGVPQGAWLKSFTVERGKAMTLRGTAKGEAIVASLVRNLEKNPDHRFRSVDLSNAANTLVERTPVTEFVVSAFPVGNLPLFDRTTGGSAAR